ncbi:MAG: hypothetical protein SXV54_12065, partial [Chloroflexota bacterium]|nr:hypothetical protein [Chloroflexota bacterium]
LVPFEMLLFLLKRNEHRHYKSFSQLAAFLLPELGEAMESLFNCYVAGDYDPEANPDDLIAKALEITELEPTEKDLDRAHRLIVQAGAIALDSRPLWWRWQVEAYGPAERRLITIANLVKDYTGGGQRILGPIEKARADAEASLQDIEQKIEEIGKKEEDIDQPADELSPVDGLIDELIEQGEARFTPEQLALCRDLQEEAIPALIDLAADEYLQMELSPGEGYAPINAVQMLGELEAVDAIPTLIDIVADVDPEAIIYSSAIQALKKIGRPALDPILTLMRYSWDTEVKVGLAEAIETSAPDERIYQALVGVWQEATWEEGKCLLAHPLACSGGEQAIPLLEVALHDPDMESLIDYNEVAYALEGLGVEAPPPPVELETLDFDFDVGLGEHTRAILQEISDPAHLMNSTERAPDEWHAHPEALAHAYTDIELNRLNSLLAMQAILLPPELSIPLTDSLREATEELTFDASTQKYPGWLRKIYDHLAECAGPELQDQLTGVLLSLQYYLGERYDIADDPDQLLAAACELSYEFEEEADELWHLFGQGGALILHGRSFWPRWPDETDCPLSGWLEGLVEFHHILESIGQIPLRPSPGTDYDELVAILLQTMAKMEEKQAPPAVATLLDLLMTQKQDSLSPAQRRRFTHQRAAIIPYLIRIVEDQQYWYEDGPGEGWAAILATRMLGELKASQATDALVCAVADSQNEDSIHEAALFSLINIGRPALPAVQTYFRYGRKVETKTSLAEVLGSIGRQSLESFDLLQQVWKTADWTQNRRMVALAFGDLRDRRAIPLLQAALQDRDADALDLDYVHWALQRLGTPATPSPTKKPPRLKTPPPHSPRLFYDEQGMPQRWMHTPWGEPICPDCNQPLVLDKDGEWGHPPEQPARRSAPASAKRKQKRKKRRQ